MRPPSLEDFNDRAPHQVCLAALGFSKRTSADGAGDFRRGSTEDYRFIPAVLAAHLQKVRSRHLRSPVHEFEFFRPLCCGLMCLTCLSASVEQIHSLCRFLAGGLRPWETPVSCGHSSETPLTPFQLAGAALLNPLDCVLSVLSSRRTVAHNFPRALYHLYHQRAVHQRSLFECGDSEGCLKPIEIPG